MKLKLTHYRHAAKLDLNDWPLTLGPYAHEVEEGRVVVLDGWYLDEQSAMPRLVVTGM